MTVDDVHNDMNQSDYDGITYSGAGYAPTDFWDDAFFVTDRFAQTVSPEWQVQSHKMTDDGLTFCGAPKCRNHARLYFNIGTDDGEDDVILTVSSEHYDITHPGTHIVDSYDDGRDRLWQQLVRDPGLSYQWVGSVPQYCNVGVYVGQPCYTIEMDGSHAPFDGNLVLVCRDNACLTSDEPDGQRLGVKTPVAPGVPNLAAASAVLAHQQQRTQAIAAALQQGWLPDRDR
jgi:hypothetical protein